MLHSSWRSFALATLIASVATAGCTPASNGGGSSGSGGQAQTGGGGVGSPATGGAGSGGAASASGGGTGAGSGGATAADGGGNSGTGGAPGTGGATTAPDAGDSAAPAGDTSGPAASGGPYACTEMMGLLTTGEWYNAGFERELGAALADKWQGRFVHYGYVMEYASPTGVVWGANVSSKCKESSATPDRVVLQAWSWELTTEEIWMTHLEGAVATIKAKFPSVKHIDLMTIIRCPKNGWCHGDKPPLGPNTDHNAGKQDCNVPDYVDAAFAKVAAKSNGFVSVAPKFEAHACAGNIDGIHLGGQNGPVAVDIATHYKANP